MHQLGEYIVRLTCAAMVCGILLSLLPGGTMQTILRLICGIFLTITALSPIPGLTIPEFDAIIQDYQRQGEDEASRGENLAVQKRMEYIKTGLEAYILDKVSIPEGELEMDVSLDAEGRPVSILLSGEVSHSARKRIEEVIALDLGIAKENQQWTG